MNRRELHDSIDLLMIRKLNSEIHVVQTLAADFGLVSFWFGIGK